MMKTAAINFLLLQALVATATVTFVSALQDDGAPQLLLRPAKRKAQQQQQVLGRRSAAKLASRAPINIVVDIDKQRRRWRRSRRKFKREVTNLGKNYRYLYTTLRDMQEKEVVVVNGKAGAAAVAEENGQEDAAAGPTILQLFSQINRALRLVDAMEMCEFEVFKVSYNRKLGFPRRIDISLTPECASNGRESEAEASVTARRFRFLLDDGGDGVCGTDKDCRAECANECLFSSTGFNQACCISICPNALGCSAFSSSPTAAPTNAPTTSVYSSTYDRLEENRVQGPEPTESSIVLKFFSIGDTPYDEDADTCLDANDNVGNMTACPSDYSCPDEPGADLTLGRCTYEGDDYECLKNTIIPTYLKARAGEALFVSVSDVLL